MQRDWLKEDGAYELARRVRAYWAKQGRVVKTEIVQHVEHGTIYCVRSDLVGGLPPMEPPASRVRA